MGAEVGVDVANCYCCGLTEECSSGYIVGMRERYGRWICGLCAEAVKEHTLRFNLCTEEAVLHQMNFRQQFKLSNPPLNASQDFISAVKHLLRRSLDFPRNPDSKCRHLLRSKSCFAAIPKNHTSS